MKKVLLLLLVLFAVTNLSQAKKDSTKFYTPYFDIGALFFTDLIFDLKQMDPKWIGGFRPSKIPINPEDPGWGTNGHTYFSVRQSTFKFNGYMPLKHKWGPVTAHFSFDLFGTGVNAGETTFRLRLLYGEWGPFLFGKNWSTFVDFDTFPLIYDWWGPSGMALLSDVMARYTQKLSDVNKLEFSIEVPGSEIDPGQLRQIDPVLVNFRTKDFLPDFITRFTTEDKWGHFKAALMLRQLSYEIISQNNAQATSRQKFGWAVNLSSRIFAFKRNTFIFQAVGGQGYAGYNNDGGVEITPDENLNATVPFQYGFVASYNHFFTEHFRVAVVYSEAHQENTAGQMDNAFRSSRYFITQLAYNMFKGKFFVGLAYQYGQRYNKDLSHANDQRIVFSAGYLLKILHQE